jgi:peroxiredoxin
MAQSFMLPLGTPAPEFSLPDVVSDRVVDLEQVRSPVATVVMFLSNTCTCVRYAEREIIALAEDYQERGISFVAINANDSTRCPLDAPEVMRETAIQHGYPFPYLRDEEQAAAKAYQARVTPDFYVFDGDLKCVYRGQLDESRPGNGLEPSGRDMRRALDRLLDGKPVWPEQWPSNGCAIAWKPESLGL